MTCTGQVGARVRLYFWGGEAVPDLDHVFDRLTAMLRDHAGGLATTRDDAEQLYVQTPGEAAEFFGAVMRKKSQVAYHLMPLYRDTELLNNIDPALRKRMQGKSCFNFTRVDDALFAELADLTARCRAAQDATDT